MKTVRLILFVLCFSFHFFMQVEAFSLQKLNLRKSYSALSCKIDSLYYSLQYYVKDLEDITYFVRMLPSKTENYFKLNIDGSYSISDPVKNMIGTLNGQQARFISNNVLKVFHNGNYHNVYYNTESFLDVNKINREFNKVISFGVDNRLLLNVFNEYFIKKKIKVKLFKTVRPTEYRLVNEFTNEIKLGRVIICNGVTEGFKNPRVFEFNILETGEMYKWKEASHSYVLFGFDFEKKVFIAADNYGTLSNPYNPVFREIPFDQLFKELTMLDKNTFDYSFSLGK